MAGRGLNKVMIIGNLGRDPEMRFTPNGQNVTSFSVAVGRTWKNPEGTMQEETEWFNVEAWGRLAEITNEYLTKGKKVYIEGRLKTDSWEDQTTHEKKYRTKLVANEMVMLDSRGADESGFGGSQPEAAQGFDEMPF